MLLDSGIEMWYKDGALSIAARRGYDHLLGLAERGADMNRTELWSVITWSLARLKPFFVLSMPAIARNAFPLTRLEKGQATKLKTSILRTESGS